MKTILYSVTIAILLQFQPARGVEDPRFADCTKGTQNSYFTGMSETVLKAFGRTDAALRSFEGINKVGGAYMISFSVSLAEVAEPITEKDFKRFDEFFDPFIRTQVEAFKKNGVKMTSRSSSFPLPAYAKGYTKDQLPTMVYKISGESSDLFVMKITFSDRKENYLIVDFTLVVVP